MEAYFELDVIPIQVETQIDDDGNVGFETIYRVDTCGALIRRYAQREDYGNTMVVWVEADEAEIAKLPQERRCG